MHANGTCNVHQGQARRARPTGTIVVSDTSVRDMNGVPYGTVYTLIPTNPADVVMVREFLQGSVNSNAYRGCNHSDTSKCDKNYIQM